MKGANVGGEGRKAEIDGGYFGGYVKPANRVENRRDRRLRMNQSGKRKVVVVIRERDGKTLPWRVRIRSHRAQLHSHPDRQGHRGLCRRGQRVERSARPLHDAPDQPSGSVQSRRRRPQQQRRIVFQPHASGGNRPPSSSRWPYLIRFPQEASWREDHRKDPNGVQVDRVVALAMRSKPSVYFCGYWQRSRAT
jgi:hypothetical protein